MQKQEHIPLTYAIKTISYLFGGIILVGVLSLLSIPTLYLMYEGGAIPEEAYEIIVLAPAIGIGIIIYLAVMNIIKYPQRHTCKHCGGKI